MIYKASSADLLLALLLMGAAVLVAPELHGGWRLLIGLPALVVVPGYLTTLALFPGRNDLSGVDRAVLSIGYSLITVPLIALLLNALPWGVTPQATAASLGIWTTLLAALAWARRRFQPAHATFLPALNSNGVKTGLLGLVSSVLIFVGLGALISQVRTEGPSTEFYLLGAQNDLSDYPVRLEVGRPIVLTLAVRNFEAQATAYRIKPSLCGGVVQVPRLRPGQEWRTKWKCVPRSSESAQRLRFDLHRGSEDIPYRTLELRVSAPTALPPAVATLDALPPTQPSVAESTQALDRGR